MLLFRNSSIFLPCIGNTTIVQRIYSSMFTANSQTYPETDCSIFNYYEALQLNIATAGYYRFSSNSRIALNQYTYQKTFHQVTPSVNLIAKTSAVDPSVQLNAFLYANTTDMLVVTSATPNQTGGFSIDAIGLNRVGVRRIGKFDWYRSVVNSFFSSSRSVTNYPVDIVFGTGRQ